MVAMVARALIVFESEVSFTALCLLCSPHYTGLFEKYTCNQGNHYGKYDGTHCPSLSAIYMFNLLLSSMNQELYEKYLCNQSSHYEKYIRFPLRKGSHHLQPPN